MEDILSLITFINDLTDDEFCEYIDHVKAEYFFTHGGCYEYALVLKHFIPRAILMMRSDYNHVVVCIDNNLYDATGLIDNKDEFAHLTDMDYIYINQNNYGGNFRFEGKPVHEALINELNIVSGTYVKDLVNKINNIKKLTLSN